MSKEQKACAGAENSSEIPLNEESDESGETVREKFMKAISGNPRFIFSETIWKSVRDRWDEAHCKALIEEITGR